MDKIELLKELENMGEIEPDKYDGSYELMREIIKSYSGLDNYDKCTYLDINAIYMMSVGTWKFNIQKKKEYIGKGCLPKSEKERLYEILDKVWDNACNKAYENVLDRPSVGMFGAGIFSFVKKITEQCAKDFILMCVDIYKMEDDNEIYDRAEQVINDRFKGMKAASASMILHCLKPNTFPILNSNQGAKNIYLYLGINLSKPKEIGTYISNCRMIKKFRDENCGVKNYRTFDLLARKLGILEQNDENTEDIEEDRIMEDNNYSLNTILYGPPGTGKTYYTAIIAVKICEPSFDTSDYNSVMEKYKELKEQGRIVFTTFHQSYGYEEFIEGIKPVLNENNDGIGYRVEDGVFKKFCNSARSFSGKDSNIEKPYVFIIDEINRGNISKIFGELITLIEDTKREGMEEAISLKLPYSEEDFSVPSNVYVLATMNTADRSISLIDTALRRRFSFIEMMPDEEVLMNMGIGNISIDGITLDIVAMLKTINARIEFLYDREHTIGHAFFMELVNEPTIDKLASIFMKSIIPLLQEYFYEDYQKIQLVLGDNAKNNPDLKFIKDDRIDLKSIFMGNVDDIVDEKEVIYTINKPAFWNVDSYKTIGKNL